MRAIVSGATGMIGNALVMQLLSEGHHVIALVRHNSPRINNLPITDQLQIVECDLDEMRKDLAIEADVFFHMAWMGVYGATRDEALTQKRNIDYTFDAIELANRCGVKRFIFASSQAELGVQSIPISCNNLAMPTTNYGSAKRACVQLGKSYAEQLNMEFIVGRILSVYGKNDSPNTLISALISKLMHGDTMTLSDCRQIWDYINVSDAGRAFVAIAERGINGKCYPIGSGVGRPLRDYVEIIKDHIGKGAVVYGTPVGEGAIKFLQADIAELTYDTGFEPIITFEEGIKTLIEGRYVR